ncbi:hypothetical protein LFM09_46925 [Lentzea alba]|uniref:hypothetical protein n=1 Tax=Lentzea alba TaxID=2714351 RepID=UPI0039BF2040
MRVTIEGGLLLEDAERGAQTTEVSTSMSLSYDHRQLETKQKAQADAMKRAADLRTKESRKRIEAAKAEESAARTSSQSMARSKRQEAARALEAANKYGKDASALEVKAAGYGAEAAKLQVKIAKAQADESQRAARQQALAQRAAIAEQRRMVDQIAMTQSRVAKTEAMTEQAIRAIGAPKSEKLRILMLGASPEGDLRITREHSRIRKAVETSLHRDQVEFDLRLSATRQDLQEGIVKFRPHIVHFSGHGSEQLISFEDDVDEFHAGVVVTASAFASVCAATDDPPTLIVFNACHTASTADSLVERFAPAAVGMKDGIEDGDALAYAAALYSSIANGQSLLAAHAAGKAGIEVIGGEHELPYLALGSGVDPAAVRLVKVP